METVLNIAIIAIVLLITYWWANQGFFSSLLHLLCVIAAGAIALAFWELVTTKLLLKGSTFDEYAWGVSLITLFVLVLAILRVATNKLAPANIELPHWANLVFGGLLGAGSGIITVGILFIGMGYLQADSTTIGFKGWARGSRAQVQQVSSLWFPVHQMTSDFYEMLSVGSLSTSTPMRQYYPDLWKQSTLVHDGFTKTGRLIGKITIVPKSVKVQDVALTDRDGRQYYAVSLHFTSLAFDFGTMLTISSSQLQLVGTARGNADPVVAHPEFWEQRTMTGTGSFKFDDPSHYITSVPAQDTADAVVYFPAQPFGGVSPRFVMIKGVRLALPPVTRGVVELGSVGGTRTIDPSAPPLPPDVVKVANDIRPVDVGMNSISGTMNTIETTEGNFLTNGEQDFDRGGARPQGRLRVRGIHEPDGEVCVQVDVSRDTPANIHGPARDAEGEKAGPVLVDDRGNVYPPIGYLYERAEKVKIVLTPSNRITAVDQLPFLPSSNSERLRLIFRVTSGVRIVGFMIGNKTVGTCDVTAAPRIR